MQRGFVSPIILFSGVVLLTGLAVVIAYVLKGTHSASKEVPAPRSTVQVTTSASASMTTVPKAWISATPRGGRATVQLPEKVYHHDPDPETATLVLPIDTMPPITTATVNPPPDARGWNHSIVSVILSAKDDISGVARTEYNLDGATWSVYTVPIILTTSGSHTLLYRSIDRSQNLEVAKGLVVIIAP